LIIFKNPFYILGATSRDDRETIVSLFEEKSLLYDYSQCQDALNILLNPRRRLFAEITWFIGISPESTQTIIEYFEFLDNGQQTKEVNLEKYESIAYLVFLFNKILFSKFTDIYEFGYAILALNSCFEFLDPTEILFMINAERSISGFPAVTDISDIDSVLLEIRRTINSELDKKLRALPLFQYVELALMLTEQCIAGSSCCKGIIVEDIISSYELFIQSILDEKLQVIYSIKEELESVTISAPCSVLVDKLILAIKDWDKYARPLQLIANVKGSSHSDSMRLTASIREMTASLYNNTYIETDTALKITKVLKEIFAELPEFAEVVDEDIQILEQIKKNQKAEQQDIEEGDLGALKTDVSDVKVEINKKNTRIGCILVVFLLLITFIGIINIVVNELQLNDINNSPPNSSILESFIVDGIKPENPFIYTDGYINYWDEFTNGKLLVGLLNVNNLNIREKPSASGNVLYTLNQDEACLVLGELDGWYDVIVLSENYEGYGWVNIKLLDTYWVDLNTETEQPFKINTPTIPKPVNREDSIKLNQDAQKQNTLYFKLGSTKEEVKSIMGTPDGVHNYSFGTVWDYDYSTVKFDENGFVKEYSNLSDNLKVSLGEKSSNITYFSLGSSKEDVLKSMGTPDGVHNYSFGTVWDYDYSTVKFDENGFVKEYSNLSDNLKVSLGEKSSNITYFTLGSSKEDVLKSMGTPDGIHNYSFGTVWDYDYSTVKFDNNGVVKEYSNLSNNLRIK
jgi:outer membrane protein assembly factor BamE (lipoprotein component of BamABCDE complex)